MYLCYNTHMRPERIKKIKTLTAFCVAVAAYLLIHRFLGLSIPCLFHSVTGLKCPGCGVTHMAEALLSLDFKGAYSANPFLFVTAPFLAFEIFYEVFFSVRGSAFYRFNNILLIIYSGLLILFGILRNIYSL